MKSLPFTIISRLYNSEPGETLALALTRELLLGYALRDCGALLHHLSFSLISSITSVNRLLFTD